MLNKSKIIYLFIVFLLVIFNMLMLFRLVKCKDDFNYCNSLNISLSNTNKTIISNIIATHIYRFRFTNKSFEGDQIITDLLINAIGNSPKLFYFFNQSSCEACVDNAIIELREVSNRIGYDQIIILSQYNNTRDAIILSKRVAPIKLINLEKSNFTSIDETKELIPPCFFIMDIDLTPKFFFVYSTDIQSLNDEYFNSVNSYLNNLN